MHSNKMLMTSVPVTMFTCDDLYIRHNFEVLFSYLSDLKYGYKDYSYRAILDISCRLNFIPPKYVFN